MGWRCDSQAGLFGLSPRLKKRGWKGDCSQLCRDVYFVFLMSVCGDTSVERGL